MPVVRQTLDLLREVATHELTERHVDGDAAEWGASPEDAVPAGELCARLLQHPCTDLQDEPAVLGDGDEAEDDVTEHGVAAT